jgi:ubiquinone/menaquinone biosynthesis C-methylase UbiE
MSELTATAFQGRAGEPEIKMLGRVLQEAPVFTAAVEDLAIALQELGIDQAGASIRATRLLESIREEREDLAWQQVNDLVEPFRLKFAERAGLVATAVGDLLEAHVPRLGGKKMIDWGCGKGGTARALMQRFFGLQAIGVDVADAEDRFADLPFSLIGPQNTLPHFANGQFDLGILIYVLHHAEDYASILRELQRIIRPGGHLVIAEHIPVGSSEAGRILDKKRIIVADGLFCCFWQRYGVPMSCHYFTNSEWRSSFEASGFQVRVQQDIPRTALNYGQKTLFLLERLP